MVQRLYGDWLVVWLGWRVEERKRERGRKGAVGGDRNKRESERMQEKRDGRKGEKRNKMGEKRKRGKE